VLDLDAGWETEHLHLEPLVPGHAAELASALDDARLHQFTGGAPLSTNALTARYERLATRRSTDGTQLWGNWVLRSRETGTAVGTVQATLPARGPDAGPAEVAWVVVWAAQERGYAKEAARSLADRIVESGWSVVAYIHPAHLASQHVARAALLRPADSTRDGERCWFRPPSASASTVQISSMI